MDTFEDVVLTTRIRLARNVSGYNFPNNMIKKQKEEIVELIKGKLKDKYTILDLDNIDDITKMSLVETHTISKELVQSTGSALIIDEKNNITTMINEEDHFRMQVFENNFNLEEAYNKIKAFDSTVAKSIKYAYDEDYGYITACPTCIGTGMRVSVMLHLPALEKIGFLERIFNEITNLGISVRGIYGENTSGYGCIYQISNQKTLGIKEKDIIEQVRQATNYVVKQERKAREIIKNRMEIKDEIFRSYGILKNAIIMSKKEAFELISNIRMGINMGIINDIKLENIDKLIENIGKNTLKKNFKEDFSKEQENIKRAEYIKNNI